MWRPEMAGMLVFLGLFIYLIALTSIRVAYREHNGEIENLERKLKERRTDEAYLRSEISRSCGYVIVQRQAQEEWGMQIAGPQQHLLLAVGPTQDAGEPLADAGFWTRLTGGFGHDVAQARPSNAAPRRAKRAR